MLRKSVVPSLTADQASQDASQQVIAIRRKSINSPSERIKCRAAESSEQVPASSSSTSPLDVVTLPLKNLLKEADEYSATRLVPPTPTISAPILPEKNLGVLRGGQYPFKYDPVYGLPVVNEVATYGEVLRDMREGRVKEILHFLPPAAGDLAVDSRCLVRFKDGRVKQSVIPPFDVRIKQAMVMNGVASTKLPMEPRHIPEYALKDDPGPNNPVAKWVHENVNTFEAADDAEARRGPRIGPSVWESALLPENRDALEKMVGDQVESMQAVAAGMYRLDTDDYEQYMNADKEKRLTKEEASKLDRLNANEKQTSWMDNIAVSQEVQAFIIRYVPIMGPIFGSGFIIGLYMLSRLVKGDLTDRMKLMTQEDDKKKRAVLKEARIAFLEEEVPALVAKNVPLEEIRKKCEEVNKKMGEKLEIADSELMSTYDACVKLIAEGEDLTGGAGSSSAASRILEEQEAKERMKAQEEAMGGGEGEQKSPDNALMEMGKLNTARIRKATDPRIMDVKRRVRAARRSLKRESKVQLSDEIIFFDDVAGNEQAKVELLEIVDFFRKPERFKASGAKAPKGVLLVGPPGNGKTLMARAVAGESGVAFISSSASEFIEMYMGLGAARVRDVFNTARKMSPCIIFIDELDAVGRARRTGGGGNDERDNTVNQLLTEMDGFEAETQGIVVMAATNRKDVLDAALTRAGRFDRSIEVRRPNFMGRLEAVKVHLREKPIAPNLDYHELAMMMGGMSGAQIAGVCNSGCFIASRQGKEEVGMDELRAAIEQSKYGRSHDVSRFISPGRKYRLAVMEAGISLIATLLPAIEPVDHATVMPSVKSPIGRTVLKPSIARYTTGIWTKRYLQEQLLLALAGRAAEEIMFGEEELSSLNQHRLMMARQVAFKLMNSGMSSHPDFENIRSMGAQWQDPSFEPGRWTMTTIMTDNNRSRSEWIDNDMEAEQLLNESYSTVKAMLQRNMRCLEKLASLLHERDRLTGSEIRTVVEDMADDEDLAYREQHKDVAFM